jgi:hypothetical protein
VYNSAAHPIKGITLDDWVKTTLKVVEDIPLNSIMWRPNKHLTKCNTLYYIKVIFLQLLPGLLIDGLLRLCGEKPLYVNIHCIIYVHIYILLVMLYLPVAGIT